MDANTTTIEPALPDARRALFVRPVAPEAPDTPCAQVQARFLSDPDLHAVAVCEAGRPVGIVDRFQFLARFATTFGQAMYGQRPVAALMDPNPVVVERDATMGAIKTRLTATLGEAAVRAFVVAESGRYVGLGSVLGLLRASLVDSEEMNGRLCDALAQSEREGALKSKFLANLSHEFRTPLNAIIGFSDVMVREISGPLAPAYRDYASDILASGQHLLSVINDLLDLSKIESGDIRPTLEPVDARAAIEAAAGFAAADAAKAGLALDIDIGSDLPPFSADPLHVRQMLLNLLSNAIKFTPRGTVRVAARGDGGQIELSVEDTGIGMTRKEIEIALRPFGQVASHLTRTHEGPGLGLPLVKALANGNGATFRIDSEPGRGTRVSLQFALAGPEDRPSTAAGPVV